MTTITMPLADFRRAVLGTVPAADKDAAKFGLPLLASVHIAVEKDHIRFEATDRYMAAQAFVPIADGGAEVTMGNVLTNPSEWALDAKELKAAVSGSTSLARRMEGLSVTLTDTDGAFMTVKSWAKDGTTPRQWAIPVHSDGEYPNIDRLIKGASEAEKFHKPLFNPALFGRIMAAADAQSANAKPVQFVMGNEFKPMMLNVTEDDQVIWVGLIMPVRHN